MTEKQQQSQFDPTRNVLDLVAAAVERQDDLRRSESARWSELWKLQREHEWELRKGEKERLDAIRKIDVEATETATRAAENRAATLAQQTETMAETLRQQVAETSAAFNAELKVALQPLLGAIEELRRWQYESAGERQKVVETRDMSGLRAVWFGLIGVVLFNTVSVVFGVLALKG